jgi:hypothetical protein
LIVCRCPHCLRLFYYYYPTHNELPASIKRQYPENIPDKFQASASNMLELMPQGLLLLEKINKNPSYAKKIRGLAQVGKNDEVKKEIIAAGLTTDIDVSYNPDQIRILLYNKSGSITFILPW